MMRPRMAIWFLAIIFSFNGLIIKDWLYPQRAHAQEVGGALQNCQISPSSPAKTNTPSVSGTVSNEQVSGIMVVFSNKANPDEQYKTDATINSDRTFVAQAPYTYYEDAHSEGILRDSIKDGVYQVEAIASGADSIEELGSCLVAQNYTIDTTAPTISSITLSPPSPVKAGTLQVTVLFNEPMDPTISLVASFGQNPPYNQYSFSGKWTDATTWQGTADISSATGDGAYTLSLSQAKDLAGNPMATNTSSSFIIDTTAPNYHPIDAFVMEGPHNDEDMVNTFNQHDVSMIVQLPENYDQNDHVRIKIIDAQNRIVFPQSVLASSNRVPFSHLDLSSLSDGDLVLETWVEDQAGNESKHLSALIGKDTLLPSLTVSSLPSVTRQSSVIISGRTEPGAELYINNEWVETDEDGYFEAEFSLIEGRNEFSILAVDPAQNANQVERVVFRDTTPPPPPSGLSASVKGKDVYLSWQPVSDAEYYEIWRASTNFILIATVNATTHSYIDTGVKPGESHIYKVIAVDGLGNKSEAASASIVIPPTLAYKVKETLVPSAQAAGTTVTPPEKTVTTPETTPPSSVEEGKILGEEATNKEETNWTPLIIIITLLVLISAGYFGWQWYNKTRVKTDRW